MSERQTKKRDLKPPILSAAQLRALEGGCERFNDGLFFEAHEFWEKDWRKLPQPNQAQVQAAILACGFFVLIGKQRLEPALRLAKLAVDRFAEAATQSKLSGLKPVLTLPGLEDILLKLVARIRLGETDSAQLLKPTQGLVARVVSKGD